jgi:alpha-glucosidase
MVVSSPNGDVRIAFSLPGGATPASGVPHYRVGYRGNPVLVDSPLGLDFVGADALDRDLEVIGTSRQSRDTSWENALGSKRLVPDRYHELTVSLRERRSPGRRVDLIFRAYDEGAAFRYALPKQEALTTFTLSSENTEFRFARAAHGYALNMGRFNTHNESNMPRIPLTDIKPTSVINLPLLVELDGGPWVGLLEADLTNYAGMYVGGVPHVPNALVTKLSVFSTRTAEQAVIGATPAATPWRVLMIAPTPGRLIETNYLVLDLSQPSVLGDAPWIKPGKAAWDWWSGTVAKNVPFTAGMNTATMEHYVDFAASHHLEFMLIDAGWYHESTDRVQGDLLVSIPEINVPEIVAHAKSKGVQVFLWADFRSFDRQLEQATALFEKWGVVGVKVDLMNRDDQEMVTQYAKWVRTAAAHHLMIDLHGAYKPTGLQRTYPNLLSHEGVMGMEWNKWSDRVTPEHDVTIPFTRMLAGPMDFTPGGFRNAARGKFQIRDLEPMAQGTRAHQLAMYVAYETPFGMVSDFPEAYDGQAGVEFIEKVPVVWDETKVLGGEPATYVSIARRKGDAWYVGAMTNWDSRDLTYPLAFLGAGEYDVQVFADGPNASTEGTDLQVSTKRLTSRDTLVLHLAPGGGAAVVLTPVR